MSDVKFGPCPDWCLSGNPEEHAQAMEEGCTQLEAAVHMSNDYGSHDGNGNGWHVVLRADPEGDYTAWYGHQRIRLEVRNRVDGAFTYLDVDMTTGNARTLAAQMLHLADLSDLHS
ncbi:hypothetical protein [Nocardioides dongxiaopingii]|uniref:hypothetical protein n=1 Tax=Nocardioides dongxiaopingii TaxID=2576036 RepID=UPI0010C76DCE|nr:hypothetical protein [Nocardioides dongxiaopingii]